MALLPPAPEALENGDKLSGEVPVKLKIPQLGGATLELYNVAFYVDVPAAAEVLQAFAGRTHEALSSDASYFARLTQGIFRRTHHLCMVRSIPAAFMKRGWRTALWPYVSASCSAEMERIISLLPNLAVGDILELCCDSDGESLALSKNCGASLGTVRSRELWVAFQRIYFDKDTEAPPEVKTGVVQFLPKMLWGAETPCNRPLISGSSQRELQIKHSKSLEEDEVRCNSQTEAEHSVSGWDDAVASLRAAALGEAEPWSVGLWAAAIGRAERECSERLAGARRVAVATFLRKNGFRGVNLPKPRRLYGVIPTADTTYALHLAAEVGDSNMVAMLIAEGAEASQRSLSGRTAADVALSSYRRHGTTSDVLEALKVGSAA